MDAEILSAVSDDNRKDQRTCLSRACVASKETRRQRRQSVMKLSICIATCNKPESLDAVLWSIRRQYPKPSIEIVIVDDSTGSDSLRRNRITAKNGMSMFINVLAILIFATLRMPETLQCVYQLVMYC